MKTATSNGAPAGGKPVGRRSEPREASADRVRFESRASAERLSTAEEKDRWKARTEALLQREIGFIANRSFTQPSAYRAILGRPPLLPGSPKADSATFKDMPSHLVRMCETPLLSADQEQDLFRRMNYLKFRVHQIRSELNPARPNRRKVEQAELFLSDADEIMQVIVSANTRLVISIIKKLGNGSNFDELLSDGITSLMNAVEKFDFDRGFRFSTYATMVLKRHLFRCIKRNHRDRTRFPNGEPGLLMECPQTEGGQRLNETQWSNLTGTMEKMLARLDVRERRIIRERFGFDSLGKKRSLQSIAGDFGVCKERVRQLEKRAMGKLREWADAFRLDQLIDADPLSEVDRRGDLVLSMSDSLRDE